MGHPRGGARPVRARLRFGPGFFCAGGCNKRIDLRGGFAEIFPVRPDRAPPGFPTSLTVALKIRFYLIMNIKFLAILSSALAFSSLCAAPAQPAAEAAAGQAAEAASGAQFTGAQYEAALEKAKAEKKPLLIYFTGSDWCPFCIYFDRDVLSRDDFKKYAEKNCVMVVCDFPRKKLPKELALKNEELAKKFGIEGFPTMVLMNAQNGKTELAGYRRGITPQSFIKTVSDFEKSSGLK